MNPLPFVEEAARCRAAQRLWADTPMRERLRVLKSLRTLLQQRGVAFAETVHADIGRSVSEVMGTDITSTLDGLAVPPPPLTERLRKTPLWLIGTQAVQHRRPWGVVGIIGTWNYPVILNVVPIAQALVMGNGVIWKPSEVVPKTSAFTAELFHDAGFPEHLLTTVPATRDGGTRLAESDVDHVVFTGSVEVGRKLAGRLAERLIPCTLELSGCDALIVMPDANLTLAARGFLYGLLLNHGQTCLAVRQAIVHRSVYGAFQEAVRQLTIPTEPLALTLRGQVEQAERIVNDALAKGATSFAGRPTLGMDDPPRFPATIFVDLPEDTLLRQEAAFAPVTGMMAYENDAHLHALMRSCPFGLATSIFTQDKSAAEKLAAHISVGSVTVNDVIAPTAHPQATFGGRRRSGWGDTRGKLGYERMSVPQTVTHRSGDFRPHYDATLGKDSGMLTLTEGYNAWKYAPRFGTRIRGFFRMVGSVRRFWKAG